MGGLFVFATLPRPSRARWSSPTASMPAATVRPRSSRAWSRTGGAVPRPVHQLTRRRPGFRRQGVAGAPKVMQVDVRRTGKFPGRVDERAEVLLDLVCRSTTDNRTGSTHFPPPITHAPWGRKSTAATPDKHSEAHVPQRQIPSTRPAPFDQPMCAGHTSRRGKPKARQHRRTVTGDSHQPARRDQSRTRTGSRGSPILACECDRGSRCTVRTGTAERRSRCAPPSPTGHRRPCAVPPRPVQPAAPTSPDKPGQQADQGVNNQTPTCTTGTTTVIFQAFGAAPRS